MDNVDIKRFKELLREDGEICRMVLDFLPGDFPNDRRFEQKLKERIEEHVVSYMNQCIVQEMGEI